MEFPHMPDLVLSIIIFFLLASNVFMWVTDRFVIKKMRTLLFNSKRLEAEYTAKYVALLDTIEKNDETKEQTQRYREGVEFWICESQNGFRFSLEKPTCRRDDPPRRVKVCRA